jgi:hypothetical protein
MCGGSLKRKKNNEERIVRSDKSANNPLAAAVFFSRLRTKDENSSTRSTDCGNVEISLTVSQLLARESGEMETEQFLCLAERGEQAGA